MIKRNFEVDIQKKLWANNKVPYVIIETSFGKISILNEFNIKRPKQKNNTTTCCAKSFHIIIIGLLQAFSEQNVFVFLSIDLLY